MNIKFWAYVNGSAVKITLKPWQELSWGTGQATDEGYSRESYTWYYDPIEGMVLRESYTEGRDCDGVLRHDNVDHCWVSELEKGNYPYLDHLSEYEKEYWKEVRWPKWREKTTVVHDQFAVAAGY